MLLLIAAHSPETMNIQSMRQVTTFLFSTMCMLASLYYAVMSISQFLL
jgi:hypothetical protein